MALGGRGRRDEEDIQSGQTKVREEDGDEGRKREAPINASFNRTTEREKERKRRRRGRCVSQPGLSEAASLIAVLRRAKNKAGKKISFLGYTSYTPSFGCMYTRRLLLPREVEVPLWSTLLRRERKTIFFGHLCGFGACCTRSDAFLRAFKQARSEGRHIDG